VLIRQGLRIRRAVAPWEAAAGVGAAGRHDVTRYHGGAREVLAAGRAAPDAAPAAGTPLPRTEGTGAAPGG
jgi:hypothetical protein